MGQTLVVGAVSEPLTPSINITIAGRIAAVYAVVDTLNWDGFFTQVFELRVEDDPQDHVATL